MKALSEYIVTAFTASLIAGIGERIAPAGMKKYITFIASLMLLIFLFTPIQSLGEELFAFTEGAIKDEQSATLPTDSYQEILKLSKQKAEESIQRHLEERFDLQDRVWVSLNMKIEEKGTILLTHISLKLSQRDMDLSEEVEDYLEQTFKTETSILSF